jgi:ribosomal protein S18 acetylase RimI-like enzyme
MVVVEIDHRDPDVALRVRELQRAAYCVEAELIGYDQMPPLREEVTDILRLELTILGAVEDDGLIGVLGYARASDTVDIDRLAVEPARFRRGVGRMLLDGLHRCESDADRFEVSTGAANRPAIALYEAMGYRLTSEEVSHDVRLAHFARPGQR